MPGLSGTVWARLPVSAVALCLTQCCQTAGEPRGVAPLAHGDDDHVLKLIELAPVVVIGTVRAVHRASSAFTLRDERRYPVRSYRIRLDNTYWLRGNGGEGSVDIDCLFVDWEGLPLKGLPIDRGLPDGHRIFFLSRNEGGFRCFVDIYRSQIHTWMTDHSRGPAADFREEMVRALLSVAATTESVAPAALEANARIVVRLAGRVRTMLLLRRLRSHTSAKVRHAACIALVSMFPGHKSCIGEVLSSALTNEVDWHYLQDRAKLQARSEAAILRGLRGETRKWLSQSLDTLDPNVMRDYLVMLTYHQGAGVRRAACAKLATFGVAKEESGCEASANVREKFGTP